MKDVKLPDLSKLKTVKKRLEKLPPQKSAEDTSNWENRNIAAPTIKAPRQFELHREKHDDNALTEHQLSKLIKANDKAK
jgi:hypothetical protein